MTCTLGQAHDPVHLSISIVSHGSGALIATLLSDLRPLLPPASEILVTFNIPEDESFLADFSDLPLSVLRNDAAKGFGANHNQAFAVSRGRCFVIVNPDIRLRESPFEALVDALGPGIGACAPVVLSPGGSIEDSTRRFPTIPRLMKRVLLKQRHADYLAIGASPIPIDWSAGMFVAFAREAFESIGGFDIRYFMYMEDADICRRLWRDGWSVMLVPSARVIHDARRASWRDARHRRWHLRSALRFLVGI